jgi:hypothetical protein
MPWVCTFSAGLAATLALSAAWVAAAFSVAVAAAAFASADFFASLLAKARSSMLASWVGVSAHPASRTASMAAKASCFMNVPRLKILGYRDSLNGRPR